MIINVIMSSTLIINEKMHDRKRMIIFGRDLNECDNKLIKCSIIHSNE